MFDVVCARLHAHRRYTVVEVRAPKFDFGRGEGHGILTDSSSSSQDGEGSEDELPCECLVCFGPLALLLYSIHNEVVKLSGGALSLATCTSVDAAMTLLNIATSLG